jgi:hypothetical protein
MWNANEDVRGREKGDGSLHKSERRPDRLLAIDTVTNEVGNDATLEHLYY